MRPTLYGHSSVSQRSTYPARTSTVRRTTRTTAPASPKLSQSTVTKGASAPLIYSPEFAYPALRPGPPPGSDEGHPGGTPSYTLRASSGGDLVFSGSSARKCFPQKSLLWYRGGVCTVLTHGHTKAAHISHIFSGAELLAPCQTGLPCTRSHAWNSISRAPNSHVKTAYPVIIFTQLTAKPPPPHPSPPKLFLPTLQLFVRTTSRHLWRSVVCFPLSL
jgi:hypothetical protein